MAVSLGVETGVFTCSAVFICETLTGVPALFIQWRQLYPTPPPPRGYPKWLIILFPIFSLQQQTEAGVGLAQQASIMRWGFEPGSPLSQCDTLITELSKMWVIC